MGIRRGSIYIKRDDYRFSPSFFTHAARESGRRREEKKRREKRDRKQKKRREKGGGKEEKGGSYTIDGEKEVGARKARQAKGGPRFSVWVLEKYLHIPRGRPSPSHPLPLPPISAA